ncbi:SEA (Seh1-associated) complex subunit [Blastocladiella emersonii ATCC 22665]|nr:SEA (Seh1-associated) complex subunit [Blastocladiella emersonii ATCC 22665]
MTDCFSFDEPASKSTIATAATNGAILVWDINKSGNRLERIINEHSRTVNRITFHPTESQILISASQDGSLKLWDLRTKSAARHTFEGKAESARDVQFNPTPGSWEFSAVFENGTVQIWDVRHPASWEKRFSAHNGLVLAVDYHHGGRWLATGGRDKVIKVWDLKSSSTDTRNVRPAHVIQTIASVGRVAWRPHHGVLQVASSALLTDYRVHVWDLARPHIPRVWFEDHANVATGFVWANANTLWSCSKDKRVVRRHFSSGYSPAEQLPRAAVACARELLVQALAHHADAGDVHVCATLTILLVDGRPKPASRESELPEWLDKTQVEEWFLAYIDLLHRFRMYTVAAQVLDKCPLGDVRTRLQESTTIYTSCNGCFKPIVNAAHPRCYWACERCQRLVNPCSVCHRIVKGQYSWCQGCGHGGHARCLAGWFAAGNRECATGCGHICHT